MASTSSVSKVTVSEQQMEIEFTDDDDSEVIESSQPEQDFKILPLELQKNNESVLPNNHEYIAEIMKAMDGDIECVTVTKNEFKTGSKRKETVIVIDDIEENVSLNEQLEDDARSAPKTARTNTGKSKITDYLFKIDKPK